MNTFQLEQVEEMISQANYRDALNAIESYEKLDELSDDEQLTLKYLKSTLYLRKGLFKEGKKYSEEFLEASRDLLNPAREIDALVSLGMAITILGDPDNGLNFAGKAKRILTMLTNDPTTELSKKEADLLHLKGIILRFKGEDVKALKMFQQSLLLREKVGDGIKIVDSLYEIGVIHYYSVRPEKCLECCQRTLEISNATNNKRGIALAKIGFGAIHRINGEHSKARKLFQDSLKIGEEIDDQRIISLSLQFISTVCFDIGELSIALEYIERWKFLVEKTGNFGEETMIYNNLGATYTYAGDVNRALEHYQVSVKNLEKIGNQRAIIISLVNVGEILSIMGKNKPSREYIERAIELARQNKYDYGHLFALYAMIRYFNNSISSDALDEYLLELKEIYDRHIETPAINQQYRLAKAIILKSKGRLADKMAAQKIFQQISEEKCVHLDNTVDALINLSELLLFELETTGNKKALAELNKISNKLLTLAKTQYAYPCMAEAYLIQSKLKLIEFDIDESQRLLSQAHLIAQEKGLNRLSQIISIEEESMLKLFSTWEKILDQNPSISDIIKISRVEDLITGVIRNKIYQNEEEVIAYADKALQIAKAWKT
ncbi:hypothetical protein CEE45_06100 [Candidatus Heimdallarchaeota archaeon B3_Heim]|nr:MAG: hypothetical protein CEE45_06100 [Candidatus Heimdallarchaeota archaeon B3_Heim]